MKLISIGFGNIVASDRIIAVINPDSAPIKRLISDARENRILIDATCGRRTRALIITDSGSMILSALQPNTIAARAGQGQGFGLISKENHND